MSYDPERLYVELVEAEGSRSKPYPDTRGIWTIGIGHNMDKGLSPRAIRTIFEDDVADAEADLDALFAPWRELHEEIQLVLLNAAFNLGRKTFMGFHRFWSAMDHYYLTKDADWLVRASSELIESRAAKQTGDRYHKLARRLVEFASRPLAT